MEERKKKCPEITMFCLISHFCSVFFFYYYHRKKNSIKSDGDRRAVNSKISNEYNAWRDLKDGMSEN